MSADGTASAQPPRFRVRSHYFVEGDVVWVRPCRLPYWPAEVVAADAQHNRVRARLLRPPAAHVLSDNLHNETRQRRAQACRRRRGSNSNKPTSSGNDVQEQQQQQQAEDDKDEATAAAEAAAARADEVTASGQHVYYFDKLRDEDEVRECVEARLQRRTHDVQAYEADFVAAVRQANALVRVVLSADKLQSYRVCGIGVVHSLMRTHVAAPRQPNTGTFTPQTARIRLRTGLENAVRDLAGFEYIWVLFQFSYAAALATGEGQDGVQQLQQRQQHEQQQQHEQHEQQHADVSVLHNWRQRAGVARSRGYNYMVVPPRDTVLRGVLATRSPHRPNFIGLSCVRLVAVHGLDVHIADHDLLHGTPVLDIKPYLPVCDAHPHARAGWVDVLEASGQARGDHRYQDNNNECSDTQLPHVRVDRVMTRVSSSHKDVSDDGDDDAGV